MKQLPILPTSLPPRHEKFLHLLQKSLDAKRHLDVFLWLQGEIQVYLPHDILLAAWRRSPQDPVHFDVISALPDIRTKLLIQRGVDQFISGIFRQWSIYSHRPFTLSRPQGFLLDDKEENTPIDQAFIKMKSAVIHGFSHVREPSQSLYMMFSPCTGEGTLNQVYFRLLLPFLDTSLRQIEPLVEIKEEKSNRSDLRSQMEGKLTPREHEIMQWVQAGKTNEVIGVILGISPFTVKNHLKRIFQKLDVCNRAQAACIYNDAIMEDHI